MPLRLPDLLILLLVVLLIFGARRLPEIGSSVGKTIQAFRKSMHEGAQDAAPPQIPPAPQDPTQQPQ
ncbi:MAG TPA: twin-arginine translocase TatA/TatE family subunit [Ktedonobacterales bacterium]|nr:twin-arginine translocase TatA/TatE family subunit [Ktedonobacterales bacterium]